MALDENSNGLELLLTSQLFLELSDKYRLKGKSKGYVKMLIRELEKAGNEPFHDFYKNDEYFAINALSKKHEIIKVLATMNEADAILFSEFAFKFKDNIEIARSKGISIFDKLL